MSKRVNLTLVKSVYNDLEKWADQQGRPVANLANYLIEKAVEEAKKTGEIQTDFSQGKLALTLLQNLTKGKKPSHSELVKFSHLLDLPTEQLIHLCDRY